LNGYSEYAFGFWARWLRTCPDFLAVKPEWANIARVVTKKDYTDSDRELSVWLVRGFY